MSKMMLLIKYILSAILIMKCQGSSVFYSQVYSLNSSLLFSQVPEDRKITCDNNFTKCITLGVLMVLNQTIGQFYISSRNSCRGSQLSKDGKVHICRTSISWTSAGVYQVIINPELGHNVHQTINSNSRIMLSPDARWLVDNRANNSIEVYKWNQDFRIFQSHQNISAVGTNTASIQFKYFSPNSQYFITYKNCQIDLFLNRGTNYQFNQTFNFTVSSNPIARYIIISQDGSLILFASDQFIALFQYKNREYPLAMVLYQKQLQNPNQLSTQSIAAANNLAILVVSKRLNNAFDVFRKEKNGYVIKNSINGLNQPATSYLKEDATWFIRASRNGTIVFYAICQIPGCTKCTSPNVCAQCINQSRLLLTQQNGSTIISCLCNQNSYTISQTLNQCVACQIKNCLRCDQNNQCAVYDDQEKLTTLQTILLTLITFLSIVTISFIAFVIIKLNKLSIVHHQRADKQFQSKQEIFDRNQTIQNLKQNTNDCLQNPTKMNLQKDSQNNFIAQIDQFQYIQPFPNALLISQAQANKNGKFNPKNKLKHNKKARKSLKIKDSDQIDYTCMDKQPEKI